jgi:hypothetical protein
MVKTCSRWVRSGEDGTNATGDGRRGDDEEAGEGQRSSALAEWRDGIPGEGRVFGDESPEFAGKGWGKWEQADGGMRRLGFSGDGPTPFSSVAAREGFFQDDLHPTGLHIAA